MNGPPDSTIVILLGAGCSAEYGAPVMRDFISVAIDFESEDQNPLKPDYEKLFDFRKECRSSSDVLDRSWDNLEELYTQAHLRALVDPRTHGRVPESIARVIWDVYRRPGTGFGYSGLRDRLYDMTGKRRSDGWKWARPVVVTTNYDLHFENALVTPFGDGRTLKVAYPSTENRNLGDRVAAFSVKTPPDFDDGFVEVIKLHGSVNWFFSGRGRRQTVEMLCDWDHPPNAPPYFNCQTASFRKDRVPLIVAPGLGKISQHAQISAQWQRAVHALANARILIIAGYSFPATDTFMSRLMAEGFVSGRRRPDIVIVNSDTRPEWAANVRSMFANSFVADRLHFLGSGSVFKNVMSILAREPYDRRTRFADCDPTAVRLLEQYFLAT